MSQHAEAAHAKRVEVPIGWPLAGVFKDLGVVGVLIWFMWYAMTTSFPSMQKSFHELIEKEREIYRVELKDQRLHDDKRNSELVKAVADMTVELRQWRKLP